MDIRILAGDLASRNVALAEPATTLIAAARRMREQHVGCVVVAEPAGAGRWRPLGMLTDRDIVTSVVARDADPHALAVEDVMSAPLVTAPSTSPVVEAIARMQHEGVRRIVVVAGDGTLAGVLSLDDVLEALTSQLQALATVLRQERRREQVQRPAVGAVV